MRTAAVLGAMVVALAATATGGTPEDPEMTDAGGDAGAGNAWGDITSGWLNETAADIVATLTIADIPPVVPQNYVYFAVVDVGTGENATLGCFAFFDSGAWSFGCAHWDRQAGPLDQLDGTGTVTAGMPGTVVLNLPRAHANNPSIGTVVGGFSAGTGEAAFLPVPPEVPLPVAPGTFLPDDAAEASRDYVLATGPAGPATPGGPTTQQPGNTTTGPGNATGGNMTGGPPGQPAPSTPGFEAPLALAALGVLALAARRRR